MRHEVEQFARDRNLTIQLPDDDTLRVLIVDDDVQISTYLSILFDRVESNVTTHGGARRLHSRSAGSRVQTTRHLAGLDDAGAGWFRCL